jgi:uncharacterized membrane protein
MTAMSDDARAEGKSEQAVGLAGKSVAVVIGLVLLAVIAMRLLPAMIKLLLIAIVVGVVIYFVRVGRSDPTHEDS